MVTKGIAGYGAKRQNRREQHKQPSSVTLLCAFAAASLIAQQSVPAGVEVPANECLVRLHVFIIAWRRPASLARLWTSLQGATYLNNCPTKLTILVDHRALPRVVQMVETFRWPHGPLQVLVHNHTRGLERQWEVTATIANKSDDAVLVLEDDTEVSPYYFQYIQRTWPLVLQSEHVVGLSLYKPVINEYRKPFLRLPYAELEQYDGFLLQQPCSWGAVYRRTFWTEVMEYCRCRRTISGSKIGIGSLYSNSWGHSWKKYAVEFLVSRNQFLLYPSGRGTVSYSTTHHEQGVHTPLGKAFQDRLGLRTRRDIRQTILSPRLWIITTVNPLPRAAHTGIVDAKDALLRSTFVEQLFSSAFNICGLGF